MPVALLLIIAALGPLGAFLLLLLFGKRLGNPLAGWVATTFIAGSFACSLLAMVAWYQPRQDRYGNWWGHGQQAVLVTLPWLPVGTWDKPAGIGQDHRGYLDVGIYVDSLTIAMFNMIALVSMLVHGFSIGYMRRDPRFARFFTLLGLFCFSMFGLVLGGTLVQIFVFWELVGLCSYLLIGFWHEKPTAVNAALKAFVTNRVGDFGFLVGLGILFYRLGNATLPNLWVALGNAGAGGPISLPDGTVFGAGLLTATGICLFMGAIGKSAQFPLHVWLPDAMEGPTPVSALIHAATMVAAGVYLVARIFPLLTPNARLFIAIIGVCTLVMAALIAMVQSDIKRVLAWSTVSQLGYMMLAMGVGSWLGGLFHLITHAFFKALLFLGAGSVIWATHHEQEMTEFGGLWRKIPITAATFGVGVLAIAGTPFFSGYYSKEVILGDAAAFASLATAGGHRTAFWLFFILPAATAYLTAFYMARAWMLTFAGEPRNRRAYEHARESSVMWVPLVCLAVPSIIGGNFLNIRELLSSSIRESQVYCRNVMQKDAFYDGATFTGWSRLWPLEATDMLGTPPPDADSPRAAAAVERPGERLVHRYVFWAFAAGISLAALTYSKGFAFTRLLANIPPIRWVHHWLYRGMYFDDMYSWVFVKIVLATSAVADWLDRTVVDRLVNWCAQAVRQASTGAGLTDRYVVDGAVNGIARVAQDVGASARAPQTGRIRLYVMVSMIALALGVAGAIVVVLSR